MYWMRCLYNININIAIGNTSIVHVQQLYTMKENHGVISKSSSSPICHCAFFFVCSVITYCYSFVFSSVYASLVALVTFSNEQQLLNWYSLSWKKKRKWKTISQVSILNNVIDNVSDFGFRKSHGENDEGKFFFIEINRSKCTKPWIFVK